MFDKTPWFVGSSSRYSFIEMVASGIIVHNPDVENKMAIDKAKRLWDDFEQFHKEEVEARNNRIEELKQELHDILANSDELIALEIEWLKLNAKVNSKTKRIEDKEEHQRFLEVQNLWIEARKPIVYEWLKSLNSADYNLADDFKYPCYLNQINEESVYKTALGQEFIDRKKETEDKK